MTSPKKEEFHMNNLLCDSSNTSLETKTYNCLCTPLRIRPHVRDYLLCSPFATAFPSAKSLGFILVFVPMYFSYKKLKYLYNLYFKVIAIEPRHQLSISCNEIYQTAYNFIVAYQHTPSVSAAVLPQWIRYSRKHRNIQDVRHHLLEPRREVHHALVLMPFGIVVLPFIFIPFARYLSSSVSHIYDHAPSSIHSSFRLCIGYDMPFFSTLILFIVSRILSLLRLYHTTTAFHL